MDTRKMGLISLPFEVSNFKGNILLGHGKNQDKKPC